MTKKKGNTKGAQGERPESRPDLAELLAAVLSHPNVPERVYDLLTDALNELWDDVELYEDPRTVRALLDHHAKRRAKRGGK